MVVTGSRIQRRDFTSNSPIVTVNQSQFQNTANVAVEATLNKLPQLPGLPDPVRMQVQRSEQRADDGPVQLLADE